MSEKVRELLVQLLEKTKRGTIGWEPTARLNEFVTSFRGDTTFTVSKVPGEYEDHYSVVMQDREGREMISLHSAENPDLEEQLRVLYTTAHDAALKVEETLDSILNDLKKAG